MKERVILALVALGGYIFYFRNKGEKCNCPKQEQSSSSGTPIYIPKLPVIEIKVAETPATDVVVTDPILADTSVYSGPSKFISPGPPRMEYYTENGNFFKYDSVTTFYTNPTSITKAEMISAWNAINP